MIILRDGCEISQKYGFGSAIDTLIKGLDQIGEPYTLDETKPFYCIVANDVMNAEKAVELKRKTGKPIIASIHLFAADKEREEKMIAESSGVIVYSELMRETFKKTYPRFSGPVAVVTLGVDTSFWTPDESVPRENFVLFAGRTKAPNKNFLPFFEKSLKEGVAVQVAGDFDYGQLNGQNNGYRTREQIRDFYRRCALHILPSKEEPFGLVTLEAMACGAPVAISTKSGVSELISEDVAIKFDPLSDYSLKAFLEESKKYDQKAIRQAVEKFSAEAHAKSFVSGVRKILMDCHFCHRDSVYGCIDEQLLGIYDSLDVKNKVVVDIGAFVGDSAVHFSKRGAKRVIAVEPLSSVRYISMNAFRFGCDNIIPVRAAFGTRGTIRTSPNMNSGDSVLQNFLDPAGEEVLSVGLDEILGMAGESCVVKMDCEGSETHLVNTSPEALRKVERFVIETHNVGSKSTWEDLSVFLTKNKFKVQHQQWNENIGTLMAERIS